jgi:hypothetical protein
VDTSSLHYAYTKSTIQGASHASWPMTMSLAFVNLWARGRGYLTVSVSPSTWCVYERGQDCESVLALVIRVSNSKEERTRMINTTQTRSINHETCVGIA